MVGPRGDDVRLAPDPIGDQAEPFLRLRDVFGGQFGDHNLQALVVPSSGTVVEWPVVLGRPPLRAGAYQERAGLRQVVDEALNAVGAAVVTQVVAGDGGTGKSQLAAAVFADVRPSVDVALWVTASERAAIQGSFADAWTATHPDGPEPDAATAAGRFLEWLSTTPRRWLVVLDDVADPRDLAGLWPTGRSGAVIVTTRRRDAAMLARGRRVDVSVFTSDEAVAYLTTNLGAVAGLPADVLGEAADLAADLGWLPLALSFAAAAVIDEGISCADYRRRLADRTRLLDHLLPTAAGEDYPHTVAGAWSLASERANRLDPAGLARPMQDLICVLDPNGIPEAVLLSEPARRYLNSANGGASGMADPASGEATSGDGLVTIEQARRAVRTLHRLSLAEHDPADPHRTVRMHALAQRASRETLGAGLHAVILAAADALVAVWPDVDTADATGAALRANATAVTAVGSDTLWIGEGHLVLFRTGRSLGDAGLVAEAGRYYTHLAEQAHQHLGPDHPGTLLARHELARWRGEGGDAAGAVAAFELLLADRMRVLGPDHPETLTTRHELARWRGMVGDAAGAAAAFELLLADRMRVLGADHPNTLTTRHELARWRGEAGDAAGAAAAAELLLADRMRVLGADHPNTLAARHELARWRGEAGDPAGAAAAFEQLLADQLRVLGPYHPGTLNARAAVAYWRGEAGDATGAAAAFELLLADRTRVLGADHPDALTARHEVARWRGVAGDPAGAAAAFELLLADQRLVLGPDHPDTLTTRHELAYWRGVAGDPAGAAAAFELLLADRTRVLGPDHPHTLNARNNLAYWQRQATPPG